MRKLVIANRGAGSIGKSSAWYGHYVYQVLGAEELHENFNKTYAEQVVKLIEERIAGKL